MGFSKSIRINDNITIGDDRTFIIAEIGSNHCQDFSLACELIDASIEAGADAVKFQSLNMNELYFLPSEDICQLYKKIGLDEEWHILLKNYCDKKGILFFSSPTYLKVIDILENIGVELYKLASAQVGVFPQLIEKVAAIGKPVLLSTGLVSYGELEKIVKVFKKYENNQYVILHCNSIYPPQPEQINLPLIPFYRKMFNCITGFSDHSEGTGTSIAAVAMGAKVIEKHFTLSKSIESPDANFSLIPAEFKKMVDEIRIIEKAIRKHEPRVDILKEEKKFKEKIIHRLVLKKKKNTGEAFISEDFEYKRHDGGIACHNEKIILKNMKAKIPLDAGLLLKWDMLEGRQG